MNEPTAGRPGDLDFLVGQLFAERYRVIRHGSTGSTIALFDATDEKTGQMVTLKLIRPRLAASPGFRAEFDEHMRAASALSHPNIATTYDWGIAAIGDTSTAYVTTETLSGGSLRDMFDRGRRLSPSQALAVGLDTCRALDYAHRRGLIHTELTPAKLVFGDDRRLRVVDFGIARLLSERLWADPAQVPTHVAWYAAPEQALGEVWTGKVDVYALSLTLTEAITGGLPFKDDSSVATLANRVGRLLPVSADMGPLAAVLEHAGRPEPADRYSAADFGRALVQTASKLPRPEPLPLLATNLFETPHDRLREPSDPTGPLTRPATSTAARPDSATTRADADTVDRAEIAASVAAAATAATAAGAAASQRTDATEQAPPDRGVPAANPASRPEPVARPQAAPEPVAPAARVAEEELVIVPLDAGVDTRPAPPLTDVMPQQHSSAAGHAGAAATSVIATHGRGVGSAEHTTPDYGAAPPEVGVAFDYDDDDYDDVPADEYEGERNRNDRRFPWKILLGFFLIFALAGMIYAGTKLFATTSYLVPDLTGMPVSEAQNQIAGNGWAVSEDHERSDEQPVPGNVIRTAPQAGVELASGDPFLIVVSDGPVLRQLPDFTGLPLADAQAKINELKLAFTQVEEHDEQVPPGNVIRWSVPADPTLGAGAMVEPGTSIELIVSIGPAPRIVPNLVGVNRDEAKQKLTEIQLGYAEDSEAFNNDIPAGAVISQSVPEGQSVDRDTIISVVISKGPDLVAFPDLAGAVDFNQAKQMLEAAGFVVNLDIGDTQGVDLTYTINGVVPNVGDMFPRGTQVDFRAL